MRLFFGIVFVLLFAFYASGFSVVAPLSADVDRFNNIAAKWTWIEGDPTKIMMELFAYTSEDVCVFGKANPLAAQGIQGDIQRAREVDGTRNGTVLFQADKIGEYILCAYEDFTLSGGTLNLSSIANSRIFSVSRPSIVQTTILISSTTSDANPIVINSGISTETDTGRTSSQGLSTGIIAGIVIGAVSLAALIFTIFILFRRIRHLNRRDIQDVPVESIISPFSHLVPKRTPPLKGHGYGSPHARERDTIPTPVQGASDQVEEAEERLGHRRERQVMYHNDSGWRPPSQSDAGITSVLEMPPSYRSAV